MFREQCGWVLNIIFIPDSIPQLRWYRSYISIWANEYKENFVWGFLGKRKQYFLFAYYKENNLLLQFLLLAVLKPWGMVMKEKFNTWRMAEPKLSWIIQSRQRQKRSNCPCPHVALYQWGKSSPSQPLLKSQWQEWVQCLPLSGKRNSIARIEWS